MFDMSQLSIVLTQTFHLKPVTVGLPLPRRPLTAVLFNPLTLESDSHLISP